MTSLIETAPGLVASHPQFVGMAHLRSLLSHDEVSNHPERTDAVLDVISLLLRESSAKKVVQAFCRARLLCEPVCYLALFRLRRWLEQQVTVKIDGEHAQALNLSFKSYRKMVQNYQREAWESSDESDAMENVYVSFQWNAEEKSIPALEISAAE